MMKLILWMVAPAVACELGLALWRGLRRRDDRRYVWASALLRTLVYSPTLLGGGLLAVPMTLGGTVLGCLLARSSWDNAAVHLLYGIPEFIVFAVAFTVADLSRDDSVGSVVLARSASANPSSFARYGPRTGPRLAHSSARKASALQSFPSQLNRPGYAPA